MKKLFITLFIVLFASTAIGATLQAEIEKNTQWSNDQRMMRIKIYVEPDGADLAEFSLKDYLGPPYTDTQGKTHSENFWTKYCEGGIFYQVETDPGTEPDAAYTLSFDSDLDADIMDLTGLSTTATEINDVAATIGFRPIVYDLKIDLGDIGSDGDEVTIYIYILR
jgi:hypothetical protein